MRYLRNYWRNAGWALRFQLAIGLVFMFSVGLLPLLRPLMPFFLAALMLPAFLPKWVLSSRAFFGVIAISAAIDATAMDWVDHPTVLWLMMVWLWVSLGLLFGIHFWALAQEPAEDSSQRAETEGTPEDSPRLNSDIPPN